MLTALLFRFPFPGPWGKELTAAVHDLARDIANEHGLVWKIWLENCETGHAGGIYLFRDEPSANAYLNGEIVMGLKKQPTLMDISAKLFDVEESLTHKTHGPIKTAVAA